VIEAMPEFANFDPQLADVWTLPMAAAWFIWRSYDAVRDQWKVATGKWKPDSDPPVFILAAHRRHPGTLACVFDQAGFDNGGHWQDRWTEISNEEKAAGETDNPYERLKYALQSGKLIGTSVFFRAREEIAREVQHKDNWVDFDQLACPPYEPTSAQLSAGVRGWNDPDHELIFLPREKVVAVEREISRSEMHRPVWKLEQALGWIAYQSEDRFRSLGRIALQPPKYFDHGYDPEFAVRDPLAELANALGAGRLNAYIGGDHLSRAECVSLFAEGIWTRGGLAFLPSGVRAGWVQKASDAQSSSADEHRATHALAGFLKDNPHSTKVEANDWLEAQGHKVSHKGFDNRVWREARTRAGLPPARAGRPRRNRHPKSSPQ
jgi:hypothetical protein